LYTAKSAATAGRTANPPNTTPIERAFIIISPRKSRKKHS
jgi:hypothetical protein